VRPDLFIGAQALVYDDAKAELTAERKEGHWMWVIFPQHVGLGATDRSKLFGLTLQDARECVAMTLRWRRDPLDVLGPIDALKLCSSLTLFEAAATRADAANALCVMALDDLYGGDRCAKTLALVASS
jgi:uncharacterized protein (DUF1810 family)